MATTEIPAASKEYVHVTWTVSVPLDAQLVELAFLPSTVVSPDDVTVWTAAEWEGNPGTTRTARLLVGEGTTLEFSQGDSMNVWSRLTDDPEVIVRLAGPIKFK